MIAAAGATEMLRLAPMVSCHSHLISELSNLGRTQAGLA
jgi:hypothetical protein